jgi:hypothetical protein
MNLKKDDFNHYVVVQDFQLEFRKFTYLYSLLLVRKREPSAFDLKTAEILKGLKGYRPESNELPIELKTVKQSEAAGELIIKTYEDLAAAYENYLKSWKQCESSWKTIKFDPTEWLGGNLPLIKAQIKENLLWKSEGEGDFHKAKLLEEAIAYRKEARALIPDEKMKHRMANEQELAIRALDLITFRGSIAKANPKNKQMEKKFKLIFKDVTDSCYEYFNWFNRTVENGYKLNESDIEVHFKIMLINYRFNKTMLGKPYNPRLLEIYTEELKKYLSKYSCVEKVYREHCDLSAAFKINDAGDGAEAKNKIVFEMD